MLDCWFLVPNISFSEVFYDEGISKLSFIFPDIEFVFEFVYMLLGSLPMFKAFAGNAVFYVIASWAGSLARCSVSSPVMKVFPSGGNSMPSTPLTFIL